MLWIDYLTRVGHVLFGIAWIGLLYYFNFVQAEYFKVAEDSARKDAVQKLVPRALWYFRYAALLTFLTGLVLLHNIWGVRVSTGILLGAVMGILMFLNVWLIIWPNQKKVIAGAPNATTAAPKAALASRTNTLLSLPVLVFMIASPHGVGGLGGDMNYMGLGFLLALLLVVLVELNAIFGKPGPMASVVGVIHCSIVLAVVQALLIIYL